MANKKENELNIVEVRNKCRRLGTSRGRVTRNIQTDRVYDIRNFQLEVVSGEGHNTQEKKDFADILFTRL